MKILHRGAEAVLSLVNREVIKDRVKKGYRFPALDTKLRKQRTRIESNILVKAKRAGLAVPRVFETEEFKIQMEFIPGKRVKDSLDGMGTQERKKVCEQIGEAVASLHDTGIMHGDLTTSNMILKDDVLYLIDFGLAKQSSKVEDQAVDLFLLYESLKAGHFSIVKEAWEMALNVYKRKYTNSTMVIEQLEKIKTRRRYKNEV